MATTPPAPPPADAAGRNLLLLVQLRWMAVVGQLAAILFVHYGLGIPLPLVPMILVLAGLVALNLVTLAEWPRWPVTNRQLLTAMVIDVAALSAQLFLSGGTTNPFVSLFLLQVAVGAVLLEAWASWAMVGITGGAFALLAPFHRPLALPPGYASTLSGPYMFASWSNFMLAAVLLMLFVTRINRNLRRRDAHLAHLRQRAAEEEHIVRMGLLASGAAHELGTPLASISVLLGDWRTDPRIANDPALAAEVDDMRHEVARCKEIVSGVLFAAGEVTGEAPERTSLRRFLTETVERWGGSGGVSLRFIDQIGPDVPIVADRALAQALTNLLDNAVEALARVVTMTAARDGAMARVSVRDDGTGFPPAVLASLGKPYNTSKARRGAGLGLFLATNVLRTLGGTLQARNLAEGGAEAVLTLPIASLALDAKEPA